MAPVVKNPPADAGDLRYTGSIPGLGRFPGGGKPLQYSCLKNHMDRGAWQSIGLQRARHTWSDLAHICSILMPLVIIFMPVASHDSEAGVGLPRSAIYFMSSFSETTQSVLAVAFLAEWLSQSSSTCSPEWNVSMLDLLKEEPVLIALQSEIGNCENVEGWNRHWFILCTSYSL